ncbi:cyclase family protein [Variovorax sp. VNK109]|uniref:cyclase family protein n=1 Tax=Variovorax sp. VNK109 TaxID=3400919 RepID=UPI003C10C567
MSNTIDNTNASSGRQIAQPDIRDLFGSLVSRGEIIDLSHEMAPGMPVYPKHVPFTLTLNRRHSDPNVPERPDGSTYINEVIVMPGHCSTHIDALGHFGRYGCVHGGIPAASIETHQGLSKLDVSEIGPILRPAVLLDVAKFRGVEKMNGGERILGEELKAVAERQGTPVQRGDIVLVRTGWAHHWSDAPTFNGKGGLPGPCSDGAQWLIDQGVFMVGSDTPAFEAVPFPADCVHVMCLVERDIHIIENLNLEPISQRGIHRFMFVGLPVRLVGATGAPFRPVALA